MLHTLSHVVCKLVGKLVCFRNFLLLAAFFFQLLFQAFQVGVHIIIAMVLCKVDQHSCGTAAFSGPTEAAITDPSARRAPPLWIQQSISNLLPVPVTEARAAELPPHPRALRVTAVGFGVGRLLSALVAGRTSWAIVDFFSDIVADSLQLPFGNFLHGSYYMREGPGPVVAHATWGFVIFLIVGSFANQAELILDVFLGRRAGRSVHQGAGPCSGWE